MNGALGLRRAGRDVSSGFDIVLHEGPSFLLLWLNLRRQVRGWLATKDARLLYRLAKECPGQGAIVEIGSAFGLSAIILAKGAMAGGCGVVHTIDTHTFYGSEGELLANLKRFGVEPSVVAVTADSSTTEYDAGPVGLLYIDGLHSYEGVKADIAAWVPRVVSGGVIVFDDYYDGRPEIGVRRAVDELLLTDLVEPGLHTADRLTWLIRK